MVHLNPSNEVKMVDWTLKSPNLMKVSMITASATGALIGAGVGFLALGPVGAILGIFIGAGVGFGAGVLFVGHKNDKYASADRQQTLIKNYFEDEKRRTTKYIAEIFQNSRQRCAFFKISS